MMQPTARSRSLAALLCALAALVAPACEDAHDEHGSAPHDEASAHAIALGGGAFEILDPQHAAHPNWIDLGDIPLGEVREAVLRMKNVEGRTIRIEQVQAGCSCTAPTLTAVLEDGSRLAGDMRSRECVLSVPAGAVVEVALRVDSVQAPVKNKDKIVLVRMTTDSELTPYLTLEARMKVHAPLQPIPPDIHIERVGVNAGGEGFTDITPVMPSGEEVLEVLDAPPGVVTRIEPRELAGVRLWRLYARLDPPVEAGYHEKWIRVKTSGPGGVGEGPPLAIKLRWTGAADVEVSPARMLFLRGGEKGGELASAELITHMPGHRLKVLGHSLRGAEKADLRVAITPLSPDEQGRAARWSIAIEPGAPLDGALQGVLVIELDDPQWPSVEVPFSRRG